MEKYPALKALLTKMKLASLLADDSDSCFTRRCGRFHNVNLPRYLANPSIGLRLTEIMTRVYQFGMDDFSEND